MYISSINKITLAVSLFAQIGVLFMLIRISKGDKNNLTEFSTCKECTLGFRKIKGECKECIGFYGTNCGHPCVKGFYGEGCRSYCHCSAGQTCNQFVGCIPSAYMLTCKIENGKRTWVAGTYTSDNCMSVYNELSKLHLPSRHRIVFFVVLVRNENECDRIEVEAGRKTPSGGDCHCLHWPLVVSLINFQAIVLGLVGYWVRSRIRWRRNHEILGTERVGHFRRRITCKKTTEHQTVERGEERPVNYDDYLLRIKKPNEEMDDVYNNIHF